MRLGAGVCVALLLCAAATRVVGSRLEEDAAAVVRYDAFVEKTVVCWYAVIHAWS